MKKYLLSIIIFTAFIGFVAYATVETMPTGVEPIKQDITVVPDVKIPTNNITTHKTNFVKKKVVEPAIPDPVVEPTPVVEPIVVPTPPIIIYKQQNPILNTTTSYERNESREDDD